MKDCRLCMIQRRSFNWKDTWLTWQAWLRMLQGPLPVAVALGGISCRNCNRATIQYDMTFRNCNRATIQYNMTFRNCNRATIQYDMTFATESNLHTEGYAQSLVFCIWPHCPKLLFSITVIARLRCTSFRLYDQTKAVVIQHWCIFQGENFPKGVQLALRSERYTKKLVWRHHLQKLKTTQDFYFILVMLACQTCEAAEMSPGHIHVRTCT